MSEPFIAEIKLVAFNFAPRGWALCNGQILPIAQNTALFSLLGTTYGGNGQTTFALPDLRGRVPIHMGQGPGLSSRNLGEKIGTETVTLAVNQMPTHTHAAKCQTGLANKQSPVGTVNAVEPTGQTAMYSNLAPNADMNPEANANTGGSQPHDNMQPYLVVDFIIALDGIYPSRD